MCQPGILKIITKIIFWWPIYHKLVSLIWPSHFFSPIIQAWGYIQFHILKTIRKYCSHFLPFYGFHIFFLAKETEKVIAWFMKYLFWNSGCIFIKHMWSNILVFSLQYLDFYFILLIYWFYNQKLYFCQIDQGFTCYAFAEVLTQSTTKLVVSEIIALKIKCENYLNSKGVEENKGIWKRFSTVDEILNSA